MSEEARRRRGRPRKEPASGGTVPFVNLSTGEVLEKPLTGAQAFLGSDGTEDHWRDVHWVYNNLWMDGVTEADAPSPGAWFWLQECRSDSKALQDFRAYYMKLAPSRKELDERARRADGGESVVSLLKEIEGVLNG